MRTETGPTLLSSTWWWIFRDTAAKTKSFSTDAVVLPFVSVFFASCWRLYFQQAPLFFPTTFVTYHQHTVHLKEFKVSSESPFVASASAVATVMCQHGQLISRQQRRASRGLDRFKQR